MYAKSYFTILLSLLTLAPAAWAAKPYNANPYAWKAVGLEKPELSFEGDGKATRSRKAWRQVRKAVNALAREGSVPDTTPFKVEMTWRGRKFVRVLHARKCSRPFDPIPRNRKHWAYDPIEEKPKCYRGSRETSKD